MAVPIKRISREEHCPNGTLPTAFRDLEGIDSTTFLSQWINAFSAEADICIELKVNCETSCRTQVKQTNISHIFVVRIGIFLLSFSSSLIKERRNHDE